MGTTASHENAAGPSEGAMQLEVMCKCLRVSFWDDERRIILGPPIRDALGTAVEHEALCLHVDGLSASATFSQAQGEIQLILQYLA